ncbi:GtrA family protein [Nonomuraea sp. NPDC049152]|uniref:GtrA family protein n=1 Tax=Nonomuraea sp. NPDC049152 TaxID=3154350 RepID=UPI0033F75558
MEFLKRAYKRFVQMVHELAKFGTIGGIAFLLDMGATNLFRFGFGWGALFSAVLATCISATFAYVGNRFWTFRHREQSGLAREYALFFLLNGIGLLIALIFIGFTTYTLGLYDPLSYNIAKIIGVGFGTLFRFWSYKRWVFLAPEDPPVEPSTGLPEAVSSPRH